MTWWITHAGLFGSINKWFTAVFFIIIKPSPIYPTSLRFLMFSHPNDNQVLFLFSYLGSGNNSQEVAPALVFRLHNIVQWCQQENKICKLSNLLNNNKLHRFSYCVYRMGWWDRVVRIQNYFSIKFLQREKIMTVLWCFWKRLDV